MKYFIEAASAYLPKHGEELCGDNVQIIRLKDSVIAVLADGLGSGVKANILATLTAKIASTMLKSGAPLEDTIETISNTLPICPVRQLAYSTFTILQLYNDGRAYIAEFDNPPCFYLHAGKVTELEKSTRMVGDKQVYEARFTVSDGDFLIITSDGVIHAGIGGLLNLGWRWPNVAEYLEKISKYELDAALLAKWLVGVCRKLYTDKPGDDTTVAVLKARRPREAVVLVGPPRDRADDSVVVRLLMSTSGKRVVCGGTTSKFVARELGRDLEVDLRDTDPEIPPIGKIKGIDLVTEGVITLAKVLELLATTDSIEELPPGRNGAIKLSSLLLNVDKVHFAVGQAINPAHQNPELPHDLGLKTQIVSDIGDILREKGKQVEITYY